MPPSKPEKQPSFSIDDFIGEIEKAEDATLNKRLPQERLKNKRALDNAARRSAEAQGLGDGKLKPQPLIKKSEGPMPISAPDPDAKPAKAKKLQKSPVTGMTLKSPKSRANSVERPDFGGLGEPQQAGFGHVPSNRVTARDISRAAAKDPSVMATMREALAGAADTAATGKVKTPGSASGKKVKLPGQDLTGAQTVGICGIL